MKFAARLTLVVVAMVVAQVGLFSQVPVAGARPVVLLVVPIVGGLVLGSDRGAIAGFAAGLAFDLLLTTPIGLCALVFSVAGAAAGRYARLLRHPAWWQLPLAAAGGSALCYLLLVVVGTMFGQPGLWSPRLGVLLAVVAGANGALAPLMRPALRWVGDEPTGPALFGVSGVRHGR